jgi:hypothetical protein
MIVWDVDINITQQETHALAFFNQPSVIWNCKKNRNQSFLIVIFVATIFNSRLISGSAE